MFALPPLPADPVAVPRAPEAGLIQKLLWVFMLSFALDYRSTEGGGGIDQLLFLALCASSSLAIAWIGRRHLLTRPGAWLVAFWGALLGWHFINSLLQGVSPDRSIRVLLPFVFSFFALTNTHIAACSGLRPAQIVNPVLFAACTNILWRIFHGFVFKGATLETVRLEVQSPANSWLAAWIGCAILLRGRLHWTTISACGVLFFGVFITVTRSLVLPVMVSALVTSFCFLLGICWKLYNWPTLGKRLLPIGAAAGFAVLALGFMAIVQPVMIERWNERLFHNAGDRNISTDISYLTRRAEADAIFEILNKDPVHYLHGRGYGSAYYWEPAYLPEIWQVLPKEATEVDDIWFAGHSIWTHGLLAGGVIGVLGYLFLFGSIYWLALRSAHANATFPGPDQWLAFLPIVAVSCLVSETITSNPFQERLAGIFFGVMAGLPQAFMVRASWIHARPQSGEPLSNTA